MQIHQRRSISDFEWRSISEYSCEELLRSRLDKRYMYAAPWGRRSTVLCSRSESKHRWCGRLRTAFFHLFGSEYLIQPVVTKPCSLTHGPPSISGAISGTCEIDGNAKTRKCKRRAAIIPTLISSTSRPPPFTTQRNRPFIFRLILFSPTWACSIPSSFAHFDLGAIVYCGSLVMLITRSRRSVYGSLDGARPLANANWPLG